jgi:cysteine dioxygenase
MPYVPTIEKLIEDFEEVEPAKQMRLLKEMNIPKEDFEEFASWEVGGYTRNCIARHENFEFILLCWDAGAKTCIHGHDGQSCWVYQVDGSVTEKRFQPIGNGFELIQDETLDEGDISFMHDRMGYHALENSSSERAMTLHAYVKPIDRCKVFNEELEQFETVEMSYNTIKGKAVQEGKG